MPQQSILPLSSKALNCYHQKLSWKISEENCPNLDDIVFLALDLKIPGSSSIVQPGWPNSFGDGGSVFFYREGFVFVTQWPKNVDVTKIILDAFVTIKLNDGSSVSFKCDGRNRQEHGEDILVGVFKSLNFDPELLYDLERCFIIEAELKVSQEDSSNEDENSKKLNQFVFDIESIIHDSKTSDVVIIAGNEKFQCHKNILSARCEVFKNMLAPHTLESESDTIEVKEVPAEAVKSMLNYIYSGKVPEDPAKLTLDLLNVAEMYLLDHLKEACVKSLIERLEVSSCISTFIMADRYNLNGGDLKELVIKFMKCKAEEVVETEDCDKLVDNYPALAKELMKAMVKGSKEKHTCQFCVFSYKL